MLAAARDLLNHQASDTASRGMQDDRATVRSPLRCQRPARLARFWAGVLGWEPADDSHDNTEILPGDGTGFRIRFLPAEMQNTGPNQMYFDLTSTSLQHQQAIVSRALELGGRHIDVGQLPEEGHVVLADSEENEFCVTGPGNNFLADTATIGALAGDGSQEGGYFWSKALDLPLVWDEDEETAIQSPHGGSKITWGGPPVREKTGKNRLQFDLAPPVDGGQPAEVDRLVSPGATRIDTRSGEDGPVTMADPDCNEFCVVTPR